jgi:alkylation response protein AidB-like acyl-CoA dehydrogenase
MGARILAAVRRREPPSIDPSILKLYVAENKVQSGSLALALTGASGTASLPEDEISAWAQSELLARFAISIGGGTNEVQRNNLAERALGLPREVRDDHELPWREVPRS